VDESDSKHLDTAALQWQLEQTRARRWTLMLRVLPMVVLGAMLVIVFQLFE
jgi:hypothetical protein